MYEWTQQGRSSELVTCPVLNVVHLLIVVVAFTLLVLYTELLLCFFIVYSAPGKRKQFGKVGEDHCPKDLGQKINKESLDIPSSVLWFANRICIIFSVFSSGTLLVNTNLAHNKTVLIHDLFVDEQADLTCH